MFEGRKISHKDSFRQHLNQYNVIRIDVQWCYTAARSAEATVSYIEESILSELRDFFPNTCPADTKSLPDALTAINIATGQKFIFVIDEWDCFIRDEADNTKVQDEYMNLLRGLFKGAAPTGFR